VLGGTRGGLSNIDPAFSQSFTLSRAVPRPSCRPVSRSPYTPASGKGANGRGAREGEREMERERERERERDQGGLVAGGPSQSSGEESIEQGTRRHRLPPTTPDTTTTNRHPEKCPARSDIGLADSAARRLHGIIHPRYLAVRSPLRRLIRVLPSEIRYRPPPAPARSEFARKRNGSRTKHGSARAKDTADLKYTTRQYEA
jgi:hypothetical protein